jgi:transketolase
MNMDPVEEHFAAFGWSVASIDGNDMAEIVKILDRVPLKAGKPSVIVANTVKSKGLSCAEDNAAYHYWKPNAEELEKAIDELDRRIKETAL